MRKNNFSIGVGEDLDPEAEVLRHLERKRSKLDYGDGNDDSDEINYDNYDDEQDELKTSESKYTEKIQELFSEEKPKTNKKSARKVKMAKKKVKKTRAKKTVKKEAKPTTEEVKTAVAESPKPELAPQVESPAPVTPKVEAPTIQTTPPPVPLPVPNVGNTQGEENGFFRKFVILVIIVLLLFLAYKYTVPQTAPTGASFAEACASNYVLENGAYELSSASTNEAGAFWLDKLYTTTDDAVARDIADMFSCSDVELTVESTPQDFEDCEKRDVYVVVTEDDVKSAVDSELATCTKIDDMISCSNGYFITGQEAMKNGEAPLKLILLDDERTEVEFEDGTDEVVYVFKSGEEWLSLAMSPSSENKVIVKLFTEQDVNGFSIKYRTEEPRVLAWAVN